MIFPNQLLLVAFFAITLLLSPATGGASKSATLLKSVLPRNAGPRIGPITKTNGTKSCIVSKVRNVQAMMFQWIEYHRLIGIDHFFIADDCSDAKEGTVDLGRFYAKQKFVSFIANPFNTCDPHVSYIRKLNDYLAKKARRHCEWIAMIDVDEYIFPVHEEQLCKAAMTSSGNATITAADDPISFAKVLANWTAPEMRLPWYIMATEAHEKKPPGLIIENYFNGVMGVHVKSITRAANIHTWKHWHSAILTNETKRSPSFAAPYDKISPFVGDSEYIHVLNSHNHSCRIPLVSPFVIKHFQMQSFEDVVEHRMSVQWHKGSGGKNSYLNNITAARAAWLEFGFNESTLTPRTGCLPLSSNCARTLAAALKPTITAQLHDFCASSTNAAKTIICKDNRDM